MLTTRWLKKIYGPFLHRSGLYHRTRSDTENYFSPPGDATIPLAPPSGSLPIDSSRSLDPNTVPRPALTRKAKVLYDYDAADKNELSLLADEVSVTA